jgi:hypothetical protein
MQPHHQINYADAFLLIILTTVTLANSYSALPDDGVTPPKNVGAVLMSTVM